MNKSFCIHGHFYQPPRDDPFTGVIPEEIGAAPFHDWNAKINSECYQPNARLGNFEKISFDIGPTLVHWLRENDKATLVRIIEQDHQNLKKYGLGNAMAQAYSHSILPLGSREDKITQIRWGIADYIHTFSHKPAGMWLPETAVDLETLEIMAMHQIEFTILAPWQAVTLPADGAGAYWVKLPHDRKIAVFFYDRPLSDDVSFYPEKTCNADQFVATQLKPRFNVVDGKPQGRKYLLLASDGEAYGHHHKFRDHFLSQLVDGASASQHIHCTFPALWLKTFPPESYIEIKDNTSWSCHHGVERWSGCCECTPHPEWKKPFRMAMNRIGDAINEVFLSVLSPYFKDPWELRHKYVEVLCRKMTVEALIASQNTIAPLSPEMVQKIGLLLRAQYERQRMFTSCGWFFDDFDRIEPKNNVAYAASAVCLVQLATGDDLSALARSVLSEVISPTTGVTGAQVFEQTFETAKVEIKNGLIRF